MQQAVELRLAAVLEAVAVLALVTLCGLFLDEVLLCVEMNSVHTQKLKITFHTPSSIQQISDHL